MRFDTVLLIDCWTLAKEEKHMVKPMTEYYTQLINFLSLHEFDRLVFASYGQCELSVTEPMLVENIRDSRGLQPGIYYALTMRDFVQQTNLKAESSILIGGKAWTACVRYRPLGLKKWWDEDVDVFVHPRSVTHEKDEYNLIPHDEFINDEHFDFRFQDGTPGHDCRLGFYKLINLRRATDNDDTPEEIL